MRVDIAQLEETVDRLLKKYVEIRGENEKLHLKLAEQKKNLDRVQKELERWRLEAQGQAIGERLGEEEPKKELRLQLDQLIAEIDKVLAKIHE